MSRLISVTVRVTVAGCLLSSATVLAFGDARALLGVAFLVVLDIAWLFLSLAPEIRRVPEEGWDSPEAIALRESARRRFGASAQWSFFAIGVWVGLVAQHASVCMVLVTVFGILAAWLFGHRRIITAGFLRGTCVFCGGTAVAMLISGVLGSH